MALRRKDFHTVTPYLGVEGADELVDFLVKAFDAEPTLRFARPEGKIAHAEVRIGDSMVMLSDAIPDWPARPSSVYLYVDDAAATYQNALAAGARSLQEPADRGDGDVRGGVEDKFGNYWWIATHVNPAALAEHERAARS